MASAAHVTHHGCPETVMRKRQSQVVLFLVIPLLREQPILDDLFSQLVSYLQIDDCLKIVFVTTEREVIESRQSLVTTADLLRQLMAREQVPVHRIVHLHYPLFNRTVSEQLNYATDYIYQHAGVPIQQCYIAVYNADSLIGEDAISSMLALARQGMPVVQQSSLFLSNIPTLLAHNKLYLAAHGLYQSCWTLRHEIPRYLIAARRFPWIPRFVSQTVVCHCVSHGLLIRLDVLTKTGCFPSVALGGEDLALGFVLRVIGYEIYPLRVLENAQTPGTFRILIHQLAGWFIATIGYFQYRHLISRTVSHSLRFRIAAQSLQGIWVSAKWLFRAPLLALYFYYGLRSGHILMSAVLYNAYLFGAAVFVLMLWKRLPESRFPRAGPKMILSLPFLMVCPFVEGCAALLGLWWLAKALIHGSFIKSKTERVAQDG